MIVDGPYGDIPIRVHTPDRPSGAGLIWAHGGAFFGGDLDMPESDWVARRLSEHGITVVTVGYRLAPIMDWATGEQAPHQDGERFHYPVASEEVGEVFTWAGRSGINVSGWVVGGASAGGNLAAGATLRLRDTGRALPRGVVLVYPVLHAELPPMSTRYGPPASSTAPNSPPPESTPP
ncbi:alpha/beta hydrolase [Actinoplanes couchii]|uniref:Alpha/beta hydrolase fold-3 domain-containing protein n=1 Tax=Actinoplanes couchii TaxID=403638 RepID=A0ABQ3XRR0_9ACTN|nr:alpha/beta hydrolase fold domain-containing protein [Actinoplanes couchii]MDR6318449.1 acetyl esterase/lipase [Actinoplanes couchii]GID61206.1 hypothetical protein Aco03nite_096100 [Actinoplanes couchii]